MYSFIDGKIHRSNKFIKLSNILRGSVFFFLKQKQRNNMYDIFIFRSIIFKQYVKFCPESFIYFLKSGGCIQYVFVSMSIQSHLGK
jgi:hypothetical protein